MRARTTCAPTPQFPNRIEHRTNERRGKLKGGVKDQRMRAVGYVRVSTTKQAEEGVSLEAQRSRIKAHCLSQGITLVDIITDDGKSGGTLKRPGLQAALQMFISGKTNAIVVLKLDRLTRSVKDLGYLCDTYFREGLPFYLMSVCDAIDTRSAAGKLILNVLMSVAQWEREAISERTQEAMDEMKRQGVIFGTAPYGWRYAEDVDAKGRRCLVESPDEQAGIRRICELYDADVPLLEICSTLDREHARARGSRWHTLTLYRVLRRAGIVDPMRHRKSAPSKLERLAAEAASIRRDKNAAAARAVALRAEGLSLRQIAERLLGERFYPPRSDAWHAASIRDLLMEADRRQVRA